MKTLEQLHASRKRWMTRLVRATNEVHKLDKKIHRLNSKPKITEKIGRLVPPMTEPAVLDIPTGLIRKDEPQLVDKLKARRKPADKTAMPLSGNAAKAYLKEQSEAVTARRKKRKLA